MERSMLGDLVKAPVVWWGAGLLAATAVSVCALCAVTGGEPHNFTELWFLGPVLAGLSALLDIAPPAVVRAQVRFENSRSAALYKDIDIVFHERPLVPGLLSVVDAQAAVR